MGDKKLLTCRASAPGKVILHGEHSVVYGKTAIAASLDLQTTSIIKEFIDEKVLIRVNFLNLKLENVSFNCEDIRKNLISKTSHAEFNCESPELLKHEDHLSIVNDYIQHFQTQNNYTFNKSQYRAIEIFLYIYSALTKSAEQDNALDLTISSNLSLGSGIGSSASFAVSLSASLLEYFRLRFPGLFTRFGKNQSTQNNSIIELSEFDKSLISKWAFCCEKISHGKPSGVDNEICCYGSLLEFRKGEKSIFHKFTKSLKICLVNTHIERNTKDYVEKVILLRERYPDTLNSIMDACNSLTRSALITIDNIEKEENPDMCNNYFRNLSELFEMNHNLLKAIGVSHPALEEIFQISNSLGFGSKLTGAGGGGNAIILIPPYKNSDEVEKLMKSLKDSGFGVNLTSLGGEGVTINIEYTNK